MYERMRAVVQAVAAARGATERCFNRLKQWHGIATRYDKYAITYLGGLTLAMIMTSRQP